MISRSKLSSEQRSLLIHFDRLQPSERTTLIAFAEYLVSRSGSTTVDSSDQQITPQLPKKIGRPKKETVIGAIKRLSETYYMLDRSELLTETSSLMSAHIMHGRTAPDVIDDLEALFSNHYQTKYSPPGQKP